MLAIWRSLFPVRSRAGAISKPVMGASTWRPSCNLPSAMRREGFPPVNIWSILSATVSRIWHASRPAGRASCPMGAHRSPGQKLVCGDYAQTLQCIAQEGADALYNGALGDMVVRDIEANGGILTREDLQSYRIIRREAVRGNYRGHEIVTVGPPSAGGVHVIQMLNILEQFDMAALGFGTAASVHVLAEALKIAFADRFEYLGDPAFMEIPVRGLISKFYAVARRRQINLQSASDFDAGNPWAYRSTSGHTTHLTVADAAGNVVAMTQTIHEAFGAKVTVPGTGIVLNNTMYIFDPTQSGPTPLRLGNAC